MPWMIRHARSRMLCTQVALGILVVDKRVALALVLLAQGLALEQRADLAKGAADTAASYAVGAKVAMARACIGRQREAQ